MNASFIHVIGWDISTSFFHASQTFLNVGFGVPTEIDDISWAFSTIYIIIGAIVYSGFMNQLFQDLMTEDAQLLFQNHYVLNEQGGIILEKELESVSSDMSPSQICSILFIWFVIVGSICAFFLENFDPIVSVITFSNIKF